MTTAAMAPPERRDFFAPLVEPAMKASGVESIGIIEGMVMFVFPKTFEIGGLDVPCGMILGTGEVVVEVRESGCDEDEFMMSEEIVAAGRAESIAIDVETCTTVVGEGSPMLGAGELLVKGVVCTGVLVLREGEPSSKYSFG